MAPFVLVDDVDKEVVEELGAGAVEGFAAKEEEFVCVGGRRSQGGVCSGRGGLGEGGFEDFVEVCLRGGIFGEDGVKVNVFGVGVDLGGVLFGGFLGGFLGGLFGFAGFVLGGFGLFFGHDCELVMVFWLGDGWRGKVWSGMDAFVWRGDLADHAENLT